MKMRYEKGATLVEVLIAAVIVGIGLLGVAISQMHALQGSSDAQYRTTATDMALSLADRMRANLPGDNDYSNKTVDCSVTVQKCAMSPSDTSATGVVKCTPTQLAAFDMSDLLCDIVAKTPKENHLPGATLSVSACRDPGAITGDACGPGSSFDITVSWASREAYDQDDIDGDGNKNEEFVVMTVIPGTDASTGL